MTREGLQRLAGATAPGLFVLLWSTGFIGAKGAMPHAEPMTFLLLRFAIATGLLAGFAFLTGAPWPKDWRQWGHIAVVGFLVHAVYLGGVFVAIHQGMTAGLSALIVSLQPVLVAVLAGRLLGERVKLRQWLGFFLGLVGVALVLSEKIDPAAATAFEGFGWTEVFICVLAVLAIAIGTLYQKRFGGGMDLRSGTAIQYMAAALACGLGALLFEEFHIDWTGELIFSLAWLVLVLSLGAVSLLMLLIRLGEANKVASLFYLVPPSTALIAYFLFGETFGLIALAGVAVTALGVALVVRK